MKTYRDIFEKLDRPALIPFFVLGDPDRQRSIELIKTAIDAGADIIELGIPFSDPIADGPTIQKADIRALDAEINCRAAFEMIEQIKQYHDIPIGLLMYYNLICRYGTEKFYQKAASVGVNSILVADLCVDDAGEIEQLLKNNGLDSVYMVTPNTSEIRQKKIVSLCSGFIYTVSTLGVTGARDQLGDQVKPLISSLKAQTNTPICVGFGVSKPQHASELAAAGADGVIVGSAVINIIEKNLTDQKKTSSEMATFIKQMREAL